MNVFMHNAPSESRETSVPVTASASESFAVPIRFAGLQRTAPPFPGGYLILLRQHRRMQSNRAWKWSPRRVEN